MQATDNQPDLPSLSRWFKIFGIVFILGGIAALIAPAVAGIAIELLIGWLFFVGGCIQVTAALTTRKHKMFWIKFLWALLFYIGWIMVITASG